MDCSIQDDEIILQDDEIILQDDEIILQDDEIILQDDEIILQYMDQDKCIYSETINKNMAQLSKLIAVMMMQDKNEKYFTINTNNHLTLYGFKKSLEYMRYANGKENNYVPLSIPLMNVNLIELFGKWKTEFTDINIEQLSELVLASNYFDIAPMMNLCCVKYATFLKKLPPERLRQLFGVTDDLTQEDIEKIKEHNQCN